MAEPWTAVDFKPLPPLPPPSPTHPSPSIHNLPAVVGLHSPSRHRPSRLLPHAPRERPVGLKNPPSSPIPTPLQHTAQQPSGQLPVEPATSNSRFSWILRGLRRRSRESNCLICCMSTNTPSLHGSSDVSQHRSFRSQRSTPSATSHYRPINVVDVYNKKDRAERPITSTKSSALSLERLPHRHIPATRIPPGGTLEAPYRPRSRRSKGRAWRHRDRFQRQQLKGKQRFAPESFPALSGATPSFYSWCSYCQEAAVQRLRTTLPVGPGLAVLPNKAVSDNTQFFTLNRQHNIPSINDNNITNGNIQHQSYSSDAVYSAEAGLDSRIPSYSSSFLSSTSSRYCPHCHPELFPDDQLRLQVAEGATSELTSQHHSQPTEVDSPVTLPSSDNRLLAAEHPVNTTTSDFSNRDVSSSLVALDPSFSRFSWYSSQRSPSSLSVQRSDHSVEVQDLNPVPKSLAPPSPLYTAFASSFRATPWFGLPSTTSHTTGLPDRRSSDQPTRRKSWSFLQLTTKRNSNLPLPSTIYPMPPSPPPVTTSLLVRQPSAASKISNQKRHCAPEVIVSSMLGAQSTTTTDNGLSSSSMAPMRTLDHDHSFSAQQQTKRTPVRRRLLESRFQSFRLLHQSDTPSEPLSTNRSATATTVPVTRPSSTKRKSFLAGSFKTSSLAKLTTSHASPPASPVAPETIIPESQQYPHESPVERITMDQFKWSIVCCHMQLSRAGSSYPSLLSSIQCSDSIESQRLLQSSHNQIVLIDPRPTLLLLLDNMPSPTIHSLASVISPFTLTSSSSVSDNAQGGITSSESSSTWLSEPKSHTPNKAKLSNLPNPMLPGSSHPNYFFKYEVTITKTPKSLPASAQPLAPSTFRSPRSSRTVDNGSTSQAKTSESHSQKPPAQPPSLAKRAIRALYSPAVESLADAVSKRTFVSRTVEELTHFVAYVLSIAPEEWIPWHLYDFFERSQGRTFKDLVELLPTDSQAVLILMLDITRVLLDLSITAHQDETDDGYAHTRRYAVVTQLSGLVFRPRPDIGIYISTGGQGAGAGTSVDTTVGTVEREEHTSRRAFENLYALYDESHVAPLGFKPPTFTLAAPQPQNIPLAHGQHISNSTHSQPTDSRVPAEEAQSNTDMPDLPQIPSTSETAEGVRSLSLPPWRQTMDSRSRRQSVIDGSDKETTDLPRTVIKRGSLKPPPQQRRRHTLSIPATESFTSPENMPPTGQREGHGPEEHPFTTPGTIGERQSEASNNTTGGKAQAQESRIDVQPSAHLASCIRPKSQPDETEMTAVNPHGSHFCPFPPSPHPSTSFTTPEDLMTPSFFSTADGRRVFMSSVMNSKAGKRLSCSHLRDHSEKFGRGASAPCLAYRASVDIPRSSSSLVGSSPMPPTSVPLPGTLEYPSFRAAADARPPSRQLVMKPRLATTTSHTNETATSISDTVSSSMMVEVPASKRRHSTTSVERKKAPYKFPLSLPSSPTQQQLMQSPSLFESMRTWLPHERDRNSLCGDHCGCELDRLGADYEPPHHNMFKTTTTISTLSTNSVTTPVCDQRYYNFSSGCRHVKNNDCCADPWNLPPRQSTTQPIWNAIVANGMDAGPQQCSDQPSPDTTNPSTLSNNHRRRKSLYDLFGGYKDKNGYSSSSKGKEGSHPQRIKSFLSWGVSKPDVKRASSLPSSSYQHINEENRPPPPLPPPPSSTSPSTPSVLSSRTLNKPFLWTRAHPRRRESMPATPCNVLFYPEPQLHDMSINVRHCPLGDTSESPRKQANDDDIVYDVIEKWREWHQRHFSGNE